MPDSISHYRLGAKLGEGGMGEVYRATDTKLGREVAIKMIPAALARDPARLASFTREAQILASLNHPNIAAIYGVEEGALVMELVEGPTLAERIEKGPIPLDEALAIARQIADALEAAHDKGIVHRDLKPGNIKITPAGTVKLLDFGLAKGFALATATPSDETPTLALSMTAGGMIVGTAGYMAPEQARGRPVDRRADVWAFGVVLHEMLTGTRLFEGETVTDVMASVVRHDPDLARVPESVRPLLRRCLEKDPKRRLRDVGDAMLLLDEQVHAPAQPAAPSTGGRAAWLAWAAAAILLLALAAVSIVHFREAPALANTLRYKISFPESVGLREIGFSLSPDGRRLLFMSVGSGAPEIWLQELDALEPRLLTGVTIEREFGGATWSPDSGSLLIVADRKVRRIDIAGGPAQTIADLQVAALGVSWHANGTILLGTPGGVMQMPATGGTPEFVTKVDPASKEPAHTFPVFLDARTFLYTRGAPGARAVHVGSLDLPPEQQATTPLLKTESGALFARAPGDAPDEGRVLFVRDGTLLAQRYDARRQQLTGEPMVVAEQVLYTSGPVVALAYFSVSEQGTLVYRSGIPPGRVRQLTWFDRAGNPVSALSELARYNTPKLSPDATRAVTSRTDLQTGTNADLWLTHLAQDASTRLTFGGGANVQPVWSPDGSQIAWVRIAAQPAIYRKSADGSGAEEMLYRFEGGAAPSLTDWSADARFLVYARGGDIWALPVGPGTDSARKPVPVVQGPGSELGAYVSHDSRWIAYISNETGRQEMYVQPFSPGQQAAGKWIVSSRGTQGFARWRADGKELLFIGTDGSLMAVEVTLSPVFKAGPPRVLFQLPQTFLALSASPGAVADVTRDHERLLLLMPTDTRQELSVVVNWQNGLTR